MKSREYAIIIHTISSYLLFFIAVAAFIFVPDKICRIENEYSYHEKSKSVLLPPVATFVALCANDIAIGKSGGNIKSRDPGE